VCTGWPIRPLGAEHDRYRVGGKEIEKERVLTLDELKAFFAMLDSKDADVTDTVRLALKCVLLTAQRPGDVAGMMLSELHDLDGSLDHSGRAHKEQAGRTYRPALARRCATDRRSTQRQQR
jgi:integrase